MDQIATNNLRVIEIELHADICLSDLCNHICRMLGMVEKVVWPIATVNRLDKQCNVPCRRKIRRVSKIFKEHTVGCWALLCLDLACEAMNRAGANSDRIAERARKQRLRVLLASGHGGKAEFAFATRRRVDAQHGELVSFDRSLHRGGRHVVGKLQLDSLEAGSCRGVDSFEQRPFGEQIAEIGGKTRHRRSSMIPWRVDAWAYSLAPRTSQRHPENPCSPTPLSILP